MPTRRVVGFHARGRYDSPERIPYKEIRLNMKVAGNARQRLEQYEELVLKWNRIVPLVSRRTEAASLRRLMEHSLAAERLLPEGTRTLIDVGSGAGLPGLPIALLREGLQVRLFERGRRKAIFLKEAVRTLEVRNVEVLMGTFAEGGVSGARPLVVTALGVGGYLGLERRIRRELLPGDGLLYFIGEVLAKRIARETTAATWRWEPLDDSKKTGLFMAEY